VFRLGGSQRVRQIDRQPVGQRRTGNLECGLQPLTRHGVWPREQLERRGALGHDLLDHLVDREAGLPGGFSDGTRQPEQEGAGSRGRIEKLGVLVKQAILSPQGVDEEILDPIDDVRHDLGRRVEDAGGIACSWVVLPVRTARMRERSGQ